MDQDKQIIIDLSLRRLFDQMPGCWGCKDENSRYIYVNKEYAKVIGAGDDNLALIGMSDFDIPCGAAKCADLFKMQDQAVMTRGKKMKTLDIHPFADDMWKAYMFVKTPLYDRNDNKKIIGTIFHGEDITSLSVLELGSLLTRISVKSQHEFVGNQNSFLLNNDFDKTNLSMREAECLFFLLRGKTAKQIARYLDLSHRTIEGYLENLKFKFSAENRYELIDKAIQAGFLSVIPESIFTKQLSVMLND